MNLQQSAERYYERLYVNDKFETRIPNANQIIKTTGGCSREAIKKAFIAGVSTHGQERLTFVLSKLQRWLESGEYEREGIFPFSLINQWLSELDEET